MPVREQARAAACRLRALCEALSPSPPVSKLREIALVSLITEIAARGALPLLVGGTMLYFKALFDGIDEMPEADPAIRAELERRARRQGPGTADPRGDAARHSR